MAVGVPVTAALAYILFGPSDEQKPKKKKKKQQQEPPEASVKVEAAKPSSSAIQKPDVEPIASKVKIMSANKLKKRSLIYVRLFKKRFSTAMVMISADILISPAF